MQAFRFSFKTIETELPFCINKVTSKDEILIEKTGELVSSNAIEILAHDRKNNQLFFLVNIENKNVTKIITKLRFGLLKYFSSLPGAIKTSNSIPTQVEMIYKSIPIMDQKA